MGIHRIQPFVEGVPAGVKMAMLPNQRNGLLRKGVVVLVVHVGVELWRQLVKYIPHGLIGQIVFADGGDGLAAHAAHKGGNALMEHGVHGGIAKHGLVRVGMHLDKARGDGFPGGVDDLSSLRAGKIPDRGDFSIRNAHVGPPCGGAGAVNDSAAQNQSIKTHGLPHLSQTWRKTRIRFPPRTF